MFSVSTGLLLALTLVAAVTDITSHKIYNWTTYPGILGALALNFFEHGWDGPRGLEDSLKGLGVCGGVMLAAFVLFNVGGGDVKLMAMLGAFLGLEAGVEAMLWTFVLGGAAGLAMLIWRVGLVKLVAGTVRHLVWTLRLARWLPLSDQERRELQPALYLAPAAVVAVIIVAFDLVSVAR